MSSPQKKGVLFLVVKVSLRGGTLFWRGNFIWEGGLISIIPAKYFHFFWGFWLLLIGRGNTESGTRSSFQTVIFHNPRSHQDATSTLLWDMTITIFFPHLFCTIPNHTFFLETRFFQKFISLICFTYSLLFTSFASNFSRRLFSLLNFCGFFYLLVEHHFFPLVHSRKALCAIGEALGRFWAGIWSHCFVFGCILVGQLRNDIHLHNGIFTPVLWTQLRCVCFLPKSTHNVLFEGFLQMFFPF